MRVDFEPHSGGRRACLSRFAKSNDTNHTIRDQLSLSADDEDEDTSEQKWVLRAILKPDSERQHQRLLPLSADDCALQDGPMGFLASGTPKTTTSPSSSFSPMLVSDALNKAEASAMTERRRKGCTPCTNHDGILAAQYAGGEKDKEEEGTELRIPESFDLGFVDHDGWCCS